MPPLSAVAAEMAIAPHTPYSLRMSDPMVLPSVPWEERARFVRSRIERSEYFLATLTNKGAPLGNQIRFLIDAYADLELFEKDLCSHAQRAGAEIDRQRAQNARARMETLCAQLREQPTFVRQCPP